MIINRVVFGFLIFLLMSFSQAMASSSCEKILFNESSYSLVVAGYSSGAAIGPALREHGFKNIIHIHPESVIPPYFLPSFENSIKNFSYSHELTHDGSFEDLLKSLDGKEIKAVFAGTETGVTLSDQLSEHFKLPGNSTKLSSARRNKWEMHRRLKEVGVDAIRDLKSSNLAEILDWIKSDHGNQNHWPVVLKPIDSAGTEGVNICYTALQVEESFHSLIGQKNMFGKELKEVLVQEFLAGTEYAVNTISQNGKYLVTEIWQYNKKQIKRPQGGFSNIYMYDELMDFKSADSQDLSAYAGKVLNALGVSQGPGHIEIMLTERGPVLIEMGARPSGGNLHLLARLATGIDTLKLNLMSYLLPEGFNDVYNGTGLQLNKHVRSVTVIPTKAGKIKAINHLAEIQNLASFYSLDLPKEGSVLENTIDLLTTGGVIWLINDRAEVIEQDYRTFREKLEPTLFEI